ncbi:hypothetical protein LJR164_002870 [Phenylobacterium sp. LjRoot164]|uniref:hypothetical protein n=1 Tax=unclassified Phenylobacterium TaxID=2640670 RepID=UPI003ED0091E
MLSNSQTLKLLGVVVRSLRKEFPEDFYKRCYYAAFAMRALLLDGGVEAEIVGGDVVAFIVSRDGGRASMQGFGFGAEQCSHFWVEADGRLLDVGPYLLPEDASYPVSSIPLVAWDLATPFPAYLRYRRVQRFPADAVMSALPEQNARCDRFIAACRSRAASHIAGSKPLTWLLTDPNATVAAARRHDSWAIGAIGFARMTNISDLPF